MNNIIETIVTLVEKANVDRAAASLQRRNLKLLEELGECAAAYLSSTSPNHYKGMTAADVREEAADVLIVAIDQALTVIDDDNPKDQLLKYLRRMTPDNDFYNVINAITFNNVQFGSLYKSSPIKARKHINRAVKLAFVLNKIVSNDDQLITEIHRKLAKWNAQRKGQKVELTD